MRRIIATTALLTALSAPAWAQDANSPVYVPIGERLTLGGVFGDATLVVQLVMAGLMAATLLGLALYVMALSGRGAARAVGFLRALRTAGPLLGLTAASQTQLSSFIGVSNARPAPSLTVMAPGIAEALLAVMLGLMAASVAVVCGRHLEERVRKLLAAA